MKSQIMELRLYERLSLYHSSAYELVTKYIIPISDPYTTDSRPMVLDLFMYRGIGIIYRGRTTYPIRYKIIESNIYITLH